MVRNSSLGQMANDRRRDGKMTECNSMCSRIMSRGTRMVCHSPVRNAETAAPAGSGFVWISEEEIERLAVFLKLTPAQVVNKYCRLLGNRISFKERKMPNGEFDCVFLKPIPGDKQQRRLLNIFRATAAMPHMAVLGFES